MKKKLHLCNEKAEFSFTNALSKAQVLEASSTQKFVRCLLGVHISDISLRKIPLLHTSTLKPLQGAISYRQHLKATLQLSIPVIIGQLGHVMMGVIDNMMIGDVSYVHLSAASLANGVFFMITIIGLGVAMILSPLVAEAESADNERRVGLYLQQGLAISLGLAAIMMVLNHFSIDLLPLMNQPEEDVALASSYLEILGFGIIPFMVFFIGKSFVDGLSLTRPAMYVTLLGLGFNVFANWLLIYGHWGLPRLELDGAGYGTLGARTFMAILMIGYIYRSSRFQQYRLPWKGPDWSVIKKILKLGIPSGMQWFFEVGAFVGATVMIGWIGQEERAAHQIAISLASITFMFVIGFSAGAGIRVGNALGRHDWVNVRRAGNAGLMLAMGFMVISAITFILARNVLPQLFLDADPASQEFANNAEVLRLASYLMLIAALFQLFDGGQAVAAGILRGIQDVQIPTLITLIAYWGVALPAGYVLAFIFDLGLYGVWYSFACGLGVSAVLLCSRFWYLTRKREKEEAMLKKIDVVAPN